MADNPGLLRHQSFSIYECAIAAVKIFQIIGSLPIFQACMHPADRRSHQNRLALLPHLSNSHAAPPNNNIRKSTESLPSGGRTGISLSSSSGFRSDRHLVSPISSGCTDASGL